LIGLGWHANDWAKCEASRVVGCREGRKRREKRKGKKKRREKIKKEKERKKKKMWEKEFGKISKPEKSSGEKSKENIYGIGPKRIYKKSRV
jgi:hypothetical protein